MIYSFATHIYYIDGETGFPGYSGYIGYPPPNEVRAGRP